MIKTKIAQILSPTRIVIAAGSDQGVEDGMEFVIYELSDPVYDPETKESLGELELHKGRVKVVHVQDKISTAVTLKRATYYSPPYWRILGSMVPERVEEYEHLPIEQSAATATKVDLKVKVGDLVRSVS